MAQALMLCRLPSACTCTRALAAAVPWSQHAQAPSEQSAAGQSAPEQAGGRHWHQGRPRQPHLLLKGGEDALQADHACAVCLVALAG
jgi:hypothetical protein